MDKNKYNIEEVFKSELEDFEMDMPQNLWSNISNNPALNSASSAKTGLLGGKLSTLIVIGSTIAVIGTALIYNNSQKETPSTIANIQEDEKALITNETVIVKNENIINNEIDTKLPSSQIDPVIEKIAKKDQKKTKLYIIESPKEEITNIPLDETNSSNTPNEPEKATVLAPQTTPPSIQNIEITEVEPNEIAASITANPIGGYAPLTINFNHDNDAAESFWDFKDGETSITKETIHTFEKQGTYDIELTVTNESGKSSTTTKTITVLSTSKLSNIPNIFTPNNDDINDRFIVQHENIETFNLYIYTKKGELIFETTSIKEGWNGQNQYNEEAKADEYIYIIKANGIDGKTFEEKGIVKLAR